MSQATYTIIVKVNGQTLQGTSTDVTFGGVSREFKTAAGRAGVHYTEKPEMALLTVNVLHIPDGPTIEDMRNWRNVTLVAECDNDITYQSDGAAVTNVIKLGDEGKGIDLEFGGPPFIQV